MTEIEKMIMSCIDYNPETGVMKWKARVANCVQVGDVAPRLGTLGYMRVKFRGKMYMAHRMAFFMYHGKWPEGQIDHINGVKTDNRIENLRDVTQRENQWNRVEHRDDDRTPGVFFDKRQKRNPWMAHVGHNKKVKYLGIFPTKEEAIAARDRALAELKEPQPCGVKS